jgi:lipoprotein NlpD
VRWQWPATGPILRRFDGDTSGKKGVLIGGAEDSPVRAAANGWVVYAGSGLVGYGRLIILKHNDIYLSAYGHNRNLLVKEGDEVRTGQVIAHMGSTGTNRTQLHFEIRRNGKPVDPLRYLPRR